MTVASIAPTRRWVGCVVQVETGVFRVLTDRGEVRASLDGAMLGEVARDRSALPGPGDWVELRRWCDGRITVLRSMQVRLASVSQLRPRRAR